MVDDVCVEGSPYLDVATCTGTRGSDRRDCSLIDAFISSGRPGDCPTLDNCIFTAATGAPVSGIPPTSVINFPYNIRLQDDGIVNPRWTAQAYTTDDYVSEQEVFFGDGWFIVEKDSDTPSGWIATISFPETGVYSIRLLSNGVVFHTFLNIEVTEPPVAAETVVVNIGPIGGSEEITQTCSEAVIRSATLPTEQANALGVLWCEIPGYTFQPYQPYDGSVMDDGFNPGVEFMESCCQ